MKRRLNPELVIQTRDSRPDERWISLRDPKHTALGREEGIGRLAIEVLPESEEVSAAFRQQLRGTESALSDLSGVPADRDPHVVLTKDCFDCEGAVHLLIYSDSSTELRHSLLAGNKRCSEASRSRIGARVSSNTSKGPASGWDESWLRQPSLKT